MHTKILWGKKVKVLRTPEARFEGLPDYPFSSQYVELSEHSLRMHYVDEGPKDGEIILMLHGEPSWSYLYRFMIPVCAQAGYRVIAPDLIGFGKSDKPADIADYSYQKHMDWMQEFVEVLDLQSITLVCQDWGSLIGLRLAAEQQQRFARIVVGNGMLPTGDQQMPLVFKAWKTFASYSPWFPISRIVDIGSAKKFDKQLHRAYNAPFPKASYKAGARAFPKLVPVTPNDPAAAANRRAWEVLGQWQKPFLTAFSSGDPVTRGGDKYMCERIPGSQAQQHTTLRGGHFLQEDSGAEFARCVNQFIQDNPA